MELSLAEASFTLKVCDECRRGISAGELIHLDILAGFERQFTRLNDLIEQSRQEGEEWKE